MFDVQCSMMFNVLLAAQSRPAVSGLDSRQSWMGKTPHSTRTVSRPILQAMKTNCRKKPLTFGEFIERVYDACGKHKAKGIVRLAPWNNLCRLTRRIRTAYSTGRAVNAHLVEFRGHDRFVIFEPGPDRFFSFP
jgi:hypothetical protein